MYEALHRLFADASACVPREQLSGSESRAGTQ